MKKKIGLISIILIFIALVVLCVAKLAYVEAADDDVNLADMTDEQIIEYSKKEQGVDQNGEYVKLAADDINAFKKVLKKGDVTYDGKINTMDAQKALDVYTKTKLGQTRNQTKGEIYTADLNDDGEVSLDDAQNLLKFNVDYTMDNSITFDSFISKIKK